MVVPCRDFSDATWIQLISLILTTTTCPHGSRALDGNVQNQLSAMAERDDLFAEWLSCMFGSASAGVDHGAENQNARPEDLFKAVLECHSAKPLAMLARQAADATLRHRTLQTRYSADVELSKREAIYHLAYGLSHELNNPLANVSARAGVLLRAIENPDQRHLLETIVDSASRGSEMLGDLMLIARPPKPQFSKVDLSKLGGSVREKGIYWAGIRGIAFELDWQPCQPCSLDTSLVCEIVWTLLRNAIEASPEKSTVRLEATLQDLQLEILVDDQGAGLSNQAHSHCFDPFYSGREAGRGLGMGLAKAKRLAEIHGGDVRLQNLPGGGCRATAWIQTAPIC